MTGRTRSCRLEVDIDSDPIAGRLADDHGMQISFSGWLGLAAALERLVHSGEDGAVPDAAQPLPRSRS